jgi:ATPase
MNTEKKFRPSKRFEKLTFKERQGKYVVDTSVLAQKGLSKLVRRGLRGNIIIPDAVIAELEHAANIGKEVGFKGLDEITACHKLKHFIKIKFLGPRPAADQIKFARFGEIDAIVRELAFKNKAVLITSDLVQAKSASAYRVKVLFVPVKREEAEKPKRFLFWKK